MRVAFAEFRPGRMTEPLANPTPVRCTETTYSDGLSVIERSRPH